jgi:hypothetical protein
MFMLKLFKRKSFYRQLALQTLKVEEKLFQNHLQHFVPIHTLTKKNWHFFYSRSSSIIESFVELKLGTQIPRCPCVQNIYIYKM